MILVCRGFNKVLGWFFARFWHRFRHGFGKVLARLVMVLAWVWHGFDMFCQGFGMALVWFWHSFDARRPCMRGSHHGGGTALSFERVVEHQNYAKTIPEPCQNLGKTYQNHAKPMPKP
jgi:hypothetical protein